MYVLKWENCYCCDTTVWCSILTASMSSSSLKVLWWAKYRYLLTSVQICTASFIERPFPCRVCRWWKSPSRKGCSRVKQGLPFGSGSSTLTCSLPLCSGGVILQHFPVSIPNALQTKKRIVFVRHTIMLVMLVCPAGTKYFRNICSNCSTVCAFSRLPSWRSLSSSRGMLANF